MKMFPFDGDDSKRTILLSWLKVKIISMILIILPVVTRFLTKRRIIF